MVQIPMLIHGRNASSGKEWERIWWFPYEQTDMAIEKVFVKE